MFRLMLLLSPALAWFPVTPLYFSPTRHSTITRASPDDELPDSPNPCWQNLLDDDCNMSTMYASNFVAGKWIKSMPCGEGIEDCDMPGALMTPETYPSEEVDVMDFLHLKRASPIKKQP